MSNKILGALLIVVGLSVSYEAKAIAMNLCDRLYEDCKADPWTSNATCRKERMACEAR